MKFKELIPAILTGCALVFVVCIVAATATFIKKGGIGSASTQFTRDTQNFSFTDGADLRQNVQAISERMASSSQYQLLQADANGVMQAVDPTSLAGQWAFSTTTVERFTQGGGYMSTSTSDSAITLTSDAVQYYNYISITPNVTDVTYTFPATSTVTGWVPNIGDQSSIIFKNATGTAGIEVILAAGTGFDFDTMGSSTLRFDAGGSAQVVCVREVDTDITCQVASSN